MDPRLYQAITLDDLPRVRALVENEGVSMNSGEPDDDYGENFTWRPLCVAAQRGHLDIVRYLLDEAPRRLYRREKQAKTALTIAIYFRRNAVAEFLAPYGVLGPSYFDWRSPPLVTAVLRSINIDTFRRLVERGCDLEEKGGFLHTSPIGHAAYRGYWDMVRVLFEAGANPNVRVWGGGDDRTTAKQVILCHPGTQPPIAGRTLPPMELRQLVAAAPPHRGRPPPTRRRRRRLR